MSDAYTSRAANRQAAKEAILEIPLETNKNGQYTFGDIQTFINNVKQKLREIYHPNTSGDGMAKLAESTTNALNQIKSTDHVDPNLILLKSRAEAIELSKQTGLKETPTIQTYSEAIEAAKRLNFAIQATIGTKVGAAEGISKKVGAAITDSILRRSDGNSLKGPNEYKLSDVLDAAIAGAIRPTTNTILETLLTAIQYTFDFRKTIAANMEQLRVKAKRVTAYGITHDETHQFVTLMANIDYAAKQDWGRELRGAVQIIRQKYKYNHRHDATSMQDVLTELAKADATRNLNDAPEPTNNSANSVQESIAQFQQMWQEAHNDYEEEANAAQSDSESSKERPPKRNQYKRGRSTDRRSRSKDRRAPSNEPITCPHCKKWNRTTAHPWLEDDRCGWNKKYKGWRPEWMCHRLGIDYKPKNKFKRSMGGWLSDDDE